MNITENATLVIEDVDLKDLELHRQQLSGIIEDDSILSTLTADQQDALQGIAAMLDAWSDRRYHRDSMIEKYAEVNNILVLKHKIESMDPEDLKGFPIITSRAWKEDDNTKVLLISSRSFNSFEPGE